MVCRIAQQSGPTSRPPVNEKKSAVDVRNQPQDFAFRRDDLEVRPALQGYADRHGVDHAWMVCHDQQGSLPRDVLLTFNVSAAGELVQYVATGSREPVLAHKIVESQDLTREPSRRKACQPIRQRLEGPQAIEFECCKDLSSVDPG